MIRGRQENAGSEKYDSAREIIQEKIRAIVEKQNKNIF